MKTVRLSPEKKVWISLGHDEGIRVKLGKILAMPGKRISLKKDFDAGFRGGLKGKKAAERKVEENSRRLSELQETLYAQGVYSVLIIFQALDAAGKDGAIKHVMSGVNPQGCRVTSFKAPSAEELDHDYLWRCHRAMPGRGMIGIFNRSYYEEVLVTRVHPELLEKQRLPDRVIEKKDFWEERFRQINEFEKYLVENGTLILKFFLNVSKEEQGRRFLARIEEEEKNWKFSGADYAERQHWDKYQAAYEDCLSKTSTHWAPWFVIPADHKWFSRLAVSEVIRRGLELLPLKFPEVGEEKREELKKVRELLKKG